MLGFLPQIRSPSISFNAPNVRLRCPMPGRIHPNPQGTSYHAGRSGESHLHLTLPGFQLLTNWLSINRVVHENAHLDRRQTDLLKKTGAHRRSICIGVGGTGADQINIPLEKFPGAAFLRAFIPEERPKGPPTQRNNQFVLSLGDHPGQGGG